MAKHKYPIGIQAFDKIRSDNFLYIDKTELIYNLAHGNSQYVFLGRPRRFGKSLLASTMHCYFEGRKDLFKGLAIENLEKEWKNHPVLHFDMSKAKHLNEQELEYYLCLQVEEYERKYCCEDNVIGSGNRFARLMKHTYEQTGSQVVVIIDEYDAPLLDVAHEGDRLKNLRHIMRNFYSPLKASQRPISALCLLHRHHEILSTEHILRTEQHHQCLNVGQVCRDMRNNKGRIAYCNE